MDRRNGGFCRMVCSYTLNGKAEDGARLLIGLRLGASLGIADDSRGLVRHLVFQRIEKLGFRLIGSHARNLLQANADLLFGLVKIALAAIKLALHRGDLMFAGVQRLFTRVERFNAAIQRFLTLIYALLRGTHLLQTLFVLGLGLLAKTQCFVLGFDHCFTTQSFRLALRILDDGMRFVGSALGR